MSDLGDIGAFLSTASVINLDWLDVDEKKYREFDTLPKQNLNTVPDLEYMWGHGNGPFVPNTGDAPRTMGDMSDAHGELRAVSESLIRTARVLIMQTDDINKIASALRTKFDGDFLRSSKTALAGVLAERGLLGRLYINAADFPSCHNGAGADFGRKYASEAMYVLAKEGCANCTKKNKDVHGNEHCAVFNKQLQIDIPFTEALAQEIERRRQACGVVLEKTASGNPRERIRRAFLTPPAQIKKAFTGRDQTIAQAAVAQAKPIDVAQSLIAAESLVRKKTASQQNEVLNIDARPVVALLRREMLKGRNEPDLVKALRLSFDLKLLDKTRPVWEPLFKEAGLYGALYTTQDSFNDCREGADFLSRHASKARAVVAGSKCDGCYFKQASLCLMYGRKLVAKVEDVLTPENLQAVVVEHKTAGTLPYYAEKMDWGTDIRKAFKAVYRTASSDAPRQGTRALVEQAFRGSETVKTTSYLIKRDIVKTASKYMNEGLYGADLLEALQRRFSAAALVGATAELRPVLAEQGLQGIKYIDPTVYDDYGNGCKTAASAHRSRAAVKYATMGDKCATCVHHTNPGHCSVLAKELVVEPPYVDKQAEQQAVLNSGRSTEVSYESLMNNGLTMMQEYQLQHQSSELELNPVKANDLVIGFGNQDYKL